MVCENVYAVNQHPNEAVFTARNQCSWNELRISRDQGQDNRFTDNE